MHQVFYDQAGIFFRWGSAVSQAHTHPCLIRPDRHRTFHWNVNWIHCHPGSAHGSRWYWREASLALVSSTRGLYYYYFLFTYSDFTEGCWQIKEMVRERLGLKRWAGSCLECLKFLFLFVCFFEKKQVLLAWSPQEWHFWLCLPVEDGQRNSQNGLAGFFPLESLSAWKPNERQACHGQAWSRPEWGLQRRDKAGYLWHTCFAQQWFRDKENTFAISLSKTHHAALRPGLVGSPNSLEAWLKEKTHVDFLACAPSHWLGISVVRRRNLHLLEESSDLDTFFTEATQTPHSNTGFGAGRMHNSRRLSQSIWTSVFPSFKQGVLSTSLMSRIKCDRLRKRHTQI